MTAPMAIDFEIADRKVDDDTHVVAVSGEIDLFTAPEFKQRMSAPIDAGRSNLVVDLSGTTFIDSSSLGVLIGAHRRLKLRGGSLVVVWLDSIVGTVARAADFDRGFRPTSPRLRSRWGGFAAAQRRGESLPPISLYKVGDLYFVRDGHH